MVGNNDYKSFLTRISIKNTTIEKVYAMWATISGMEQWFLKMCAYKKSETEWYSAFDKVIATTKYSWYWHGWCDEEVKKGEILEANGVDSIGFTFAQQGALNMLCTVKIYTENDEIICALTQTNIPTQNELASNFYIQDLMGWTFYLTNLKSVLEGGIDLRNKNEAIKNVLNS